MRKGIGDHSYQIGGMTSAGGRDDCVAIGPSETTPIIATLWSLARASWRLSQTWQPMLQQQIEPVASMTKDICAQGCYTE